ncbi:hypothetical protein [Rhodovulum sulfidophilum]|uniref:hypothetical protein n=1 Tax=Rhodovulum sulfidophilum TaxID=35806 RepID=UPI00138975AA|nr:hypothetical protein [Rhodovulum sulfidophilum]NDK36948.1 hypothetical protein [Rhodovulum sulfidophilum]
MADASTSTRCYWIRDQDGAEILIPMCWGAAIGGPAECTCNVPEKGDTGRRITRPWRGFRNGIGVPK